VNCLREVRVLLTIFVLRQHHQTMIFSIYKHSNNLHFKSLMFSIFIVMIHFIVISVNTEITKYCKYLFAMKMPPRHSVILKHDFPPEKNVA